MNNYLNGKRILLTAQKDFFSLRRQFILVPVTIAALLLMIGLISGYSAPVSMTAYRIFFTLALYIGGLICTAMVFKDRHGRESIHNWLMLPASTLEKYLVRFLFSTIGVILLCFAAVWVSSLLTSICNRFLYKHTMTLFNPFDSREIWWEIQGYLALHSLFFLGATWFRKNHLIKTLLTLFLIQIAISLVSGGLGYMFLIRFALNNPLHISDEIFLSNPLLNGRQAVFFGRLLLQGIIPISCWTAAYFRLKEAEIQDGV